MKIKVIAATILILTLLSSACKTQKETCTKVKLDSTSVHRVEAMADITMLSYKVVEGPLKGYLLEVMTNGELKEYEVILIHPDPNKQLDCNKLDVENWKLTEDKNHEEQTMTFRLQAKAACGKNTYCFDLTYEGSMMQMMREPHIMETAPEQPEDSPSPDK